MHNLSFSPERLLESAHLPTGELEVRSPFDDELLATVPTQGMACAMDRLAAAHALFRDRSAWLPIPERIVILQRTAELMESQQDELAMLAASEGGKPLQDSAVEVTRAINGIHLCIEGLRDERGRVISLGTTPASADRTAFTLKEPIGVVVAISAFNHPLNLIVHQVAPAVACGCPVIVKPAGTTPLSCLKFIQILRDAGLPADWCQVLVTDTNETAQALATDPRVAFFSFIGSARVGWMLRSKLAAGTRCALEHGGVAPVLLLEDFEPETAAESIAKGGFYHAGQVCVSVQRVFVPGPATRAFADRLAGCASRLVVGDPCHSSTEVGPLIRPQEVTRVHEWVQEAVRDGGELRCGGKILSNNCYAPTVVLDPPPDSRLSTEEVFGPVICVYSYANIDAAVEQANSLPTAFQAAVFGRDIDQALQTAERLDGSAVMINDHTAFRDDVMPFAGLRESGLGTGGIPYTMADMQVEKMTVIHRRSAKQPGK